MTAARRLGVLGGTFDPIHFGHLDAAEAARASLELDEVLFIPAHDPPHKAAEPHASGFHRFALVALAIQEWPGYRASDMELGREGTSYTVDTLRALHACGWSPSKVFFIVGADAFAEIATWREFPAVLDFAQFAVIARPGVSLEDALARTPDLASRVRVPASRAWTDEDGTAIYLVEARTRDVSSTVIRARLAQRKAIDDLVPAPVARHIIAHHLYGAVDNLHGEDEGNGNEGNREDA
jgi:nicotinate-nucleotide adenylyltransferase